MSSAVIDFMKQYLNTTISFNSSNELPENCIATKKYLISEQDKR